VKSNEPLTLQEFLDDFEMKVPSDVRMVGRSYFKVYDESWLKHHPHYIGECIAHERGNTCIPSIDFLQVMGKNAKKRVVVDDKGEWLFICGRDLFTATITQRKGVELGDIVVVLNKHGECIGYGEVIAPFELKNVVIKRRFDIGDLLRREKNRRKVRHGAKKRRKSR